MFKAFRAFLAGCLAITLVSCQTQAKEEKMQIPKATYVYASQSGRATLDRTADETGNPFASALIELLSLPELTYGDLLLQLVELTKLKSKDYQVPEVFLSPDLVMTNRAISSQHEKSRIAVLLVYSDYAASDRLSSLPGAEHDMKRVAAALETAGFTVRRHLNPARGEVTDLLEKLASDTADQDIAFFYTTGHGVEVDGIVYLVPSDFKLGDGRINLADRAIAVSKLGNELRAKEANVLFFAGCRTNPL